MWPFHAHAAACQYHFKIQNSYEYYKTFTDMCSAISTYYRTARFTLDILKFANRKAALFCTNL